MQSLGEKISESDLRTCLQALIGEDGPTFPVAPSPGLTGAGGSAGGGGGPRMTADRFASEILGFEDADGDAEGVSADGM